MPEINMDYVRLVLNLIGTAIEQLDGISKEAAEKRWMFDMTRLSKMAEQNKMVEGSLRTVEEQVKVARDTLEHLAGMPAEDARKAYMAVVTAYNAYVEAEEARLKKESSEETVNVAKDNLYSAAVVFDIPPRSTLSLA